MELALPTTVSCPPSLDWHTRTEWRTQGAKVVKVALYHLGEKARPIGGHTTRCAGANQGKEGGIHVWAGLVAPSSQTVGSNKRMGLSGATFGGS